MQLPGLVTSVKVIAGLASQLSEALAVPVFTGKEDSSQLMVILAGQVIIGAEISCTVIVCVQLLVFEQISVAVQVRVIT
jgi:hypothetical protein